MKRDSPSSDFTLMTGSAPKKLDLTTLAKHYNDFSMQRYTKSIVYWDASIEFFLIPLLLIVGISLIWYA